MLRYFTGKLFKSNILPAVIKYKLHRASGVERREGEMRRRQSIVHRRGCGTPDAPRRGPDNNSTRARARAESFDGFASEERRRRRGTYANEICESILRTRSPVVIDIAVDAFPLGEREMVSRSRGELAKARRIRPLAAGKADASTAKSAGCLVGIYVCHDSLLLASQLIYVSGSSRRHVIAESSEIRRLSIHPALNLLAESALDFALTIFTLRHWLKKFTRRTGVRTRVPNCAVSITSSTR